MATSFIDDLKSRGLIYQKTPGIEKVFERGTTLYIGFDAQGESFHIGHLVWIVFLKRALQFRNKVIVIAGGGTSMVGDPSGKDIERPILPKEKIAENKEKLKKQLEKFLDFSGGKTQMVDNADWLEKITLVDFLREVGKFISVSSMIDKESVKTRITRQEGISFTEFSYQLLQAYDFLSLFEKYKCEVQIGGSDQWGNIIQGVELIRKKIGKEAHALCFPLITNPKTGKKFGKTESGEAIWLDPEKTHPFAFYQFLMNVEDSLCTTLMNYFSFKSREEIENLIKEWENKKESRLLQRKLAFELTSLVHGEKLALQCEKVAEILFGKGLEMIQKEDLDFAKHALPYKKIQSKDKFILEEIVVELGVCKSKGDARRLISQNGLRSEFLFDKYFLIKKGKRDYAIVEI